MDPQTELSEKIVNLYKKETFYEKYGIQLIIALIIIFIFLSWSLYYYILNHKPYIKKHWNTEKCNPLFMPFAGVISDNPNEPNLIAVEKNFFGCVINILTSIADILLEPFYYSLYLIIQTRDAIIDAINAVRAILSSLRQEISKMVRDIEQRTLSITIPIVNQTIIIKDMTQKFNGVCTALLYFLFGVYLMLKSLVGSIVEIIIILILAVSFGTIVALVVTAFIPIFGAWAIPVAITAILLYIAIMIPLVMMDVAFTEIFQATGHHVRGPPAGP